MNTPAAIKSQLKHLASEFNLEYNPNWFNYDWISKKQEILDEFLSDCPDPLYNKYGKTVPQRIKNLDKFVNSRDFKSCLKRFGGQVCTKKGLKDNKEILKKISNQEVKKELKKLIKTANKYLKNSDSVALLTKTLIKKEQEWLMKYILRHEWIHILLYKNSIQFKKKGIKYYPYDEGLNQYLAAFADNNLKKLEVFRDEEDYSVEKKGWIYAIKFRNWLKDSKTPEERRNKIQEIYHE